ncbi:Phage_base_V domain-containing protein (plasmid) [Rhodovastum atsumiense]|uniref:Gp5/Type VI secretion system Vgr protein OB-fold domain-containing protein n=1 Tax=Rhodovastum atsumiense TaxID=504468 RepID=A0A5M6IU84_9PROT|nr:phage baseplate assembly protein V [Rhodovastum atsumiense]KAA5611883.1 hypothetical protein F1189_12690 [Rhodovastum atsumiense]CAH2606138.1 Phage_base_V domain-containing protein [Rhodovastum atsumiense]
METWQHAMLMRAAVMDGSAGQARWGIVDTVNADRPSARVRIKPEDVLSGDLPIPSLMAGNGVGIVALPSPGDQVLLLPLEGSGQHYAVLPGTWTTGFPVPTSPATGKPVQPGEIGLVTSGAVIHVENGNVHISASHLRVKADETVIDSEVRITKNLVVEQDISDRNGAHGTFGRLRDTYNIHDHPGVRAGGERTAQPEQQV